MDRWTDNDTQPVSNREVRTSFKNKAITGVLDQKTTKVPGTKTSGSLLQDWLRYNLVKSDRIGRPA